MLPADHAAVVEGRTLFPSRVKFVEETARVLKSGLHSRKIGMEVTKGRLKDAPIYTLTLQERATCPSSCGHWLTCYGNNMHAAVRVQHDGDFEEVLWLELEALQAAHPAGYLVRLHVLGDFYSEDYVGLWLQALDAFPALNIFGYTAHGIESPIGKRLYTAAVARWSRFAIRFSGEDWREMGAPTIAADAKHPVAITCPAQTGATECCGTCTLCWTTRRSVAFQQHGSKKGESKMAWNKLDNPKPTASAMPADAFRVSARDAPHRKNAVTAPRRFITIKLGRLLCERASMLQKEHRVHIMKGSGEDDGKIAIALDDSSGKFVAKKKSDGRYEINLTAHAAAGQFSTTFPPFGGVGTLMRPAGAPPVITLTATPDFLAAA